MSTDDIIRSSEAAIEAEYRRAMVVEPRQRRLARVVADLGLPVPADWATVNDDGTVEFLPLTAAEGDRLLCLLEDIAANRPVQVIVTRGSATLFEPGAPAGPVPAPHPSSVHVVVPR
jgi:hypothetical protein